MGDSASFYVRTGRPAALLFDDLQNAAAEIDRDAVVSPPTMVADSDQVLAGTRFLTLMVTGFAAIAAFLAMLGVYGVTAYAVQQRRKEVAIRVALGASGRAVVGMFVRQGVLLLGVGNYGRPDRRRGRITVSAPPDLRCAGFRSINIRARERIAAGAGFTAVFWAARRRPPRQPARTQRQLVSFKTCQEPGAGSQGV